MAAKQDFQYLEDLLNDWGLVDLFPVLKAEEISIEELKIMKPHHLRELLRNQKLGIRIRFEHYFEQWRRDIRRPFLQVNSPEETLTCQQELKQQMQNSTANYDPDYIPNSSRISKSVLSFTKNTTLDENSLLLKPNTESNELDESNNSVSIFQYKHVKNEIQLKDKNINVFKILIESGSKGESLLRQYEEHQTFTPLQRTLLIALIVSYFLMKSYHLSLSTSYILEKQIIELFPKEKVEYYRASKGRGRIYMKYFNAKRRETDFFPDKKRPRQSNAAEAGDSSDMDLIPEHSNQSQNSMENENASMDENLEAYLVKTEYLCE